jgi:branched-chain amino acid transport system permease protein
VLNIDLFVNGLIVGVLYALMAVGLTLIFGILKVVNFAHGEFYMLGSYAYTLAAAALGISPWLALPVAVVVGYVVGYLTERLLMRPLYSGYSSWGLMKDEYAVVVTFALSILLVNFVDKVVGPYPRLGPALVAISRVRAGPVMLSGQKIVATGVGLLVIAGLAFAVRSTLWGRRIQAVAQNRLGASLAGIDTARVSSTVFSAAGALAALAGALLAPIINASPDVGTFPAIKSYVIVVLGGMGSMPGSILASLALGVLESFGAVYISYGYRDTFGLLILMLVLLVRPQGLFGEQGRVV